MAALLFAIYVVSALAARSGKGGWGMFPMCGVLGKPQDGQLPQDGFGRMSEYRRSFADATCPGHRSLSSLGPPMDEA